MPNIRHSFVSAEPDGSDSTLIRPSNWNDLLQYTDDSGAPSGVDAVIRQSLTSDLNLYVRTDGSDSNDGLTNTADGAFLTIQAAVNRAAFYYDANNSGIAINVADGTYTEYVRFFSPIGMSPVSIAGFGFRVVGNTGNPASVIVNGGFSVQGTTSTQPYVTGFTINGDGANFSLWGHAGGWLRVGNVILGSNTTYQVNADYNGVVEFMENFTISGGSSVFAVCNYGGFIMGLTGITCTLVGNPSYSLAFAYAAVTSQQLWMGTAFSGAAVGAGIKYWVRSNSAIDTNGGGANFFPGTNPGTTDTGGQYI